VSAPSTPAAPDAATWWIARKTLVIRGVPRTLRLVHFPTGWVASFDSESGPTMAVDASPHLAVSRALEPLGIGMVDAMTLVGSMVH
jgi:hypothetical protein